MIKNSPANAGGAGDQVQPLGHEDPLEEEMELPPAFLPKNSHRQRSLTGYRPLGPKESDTTEKLGMGTWHTLSHW